MKLIVGLGNPGKKYNKTRHNVGFDVINAMADKLGLQFKEKFQAALSETTINNEKIFFLKPLTYMNLSGNAIAQIANFYKIDNNQIFIIYDDVSMSFGKIRVRNKGSAGGHNGVKSIISTIGPEFLRLKIGIGNQKEIELDRYVLGKFTKEERINIDEIIKKQVIDIVMSFINEELRDKT